MGLEFEAEKYIEEQLKSYIFKQFLYENADVVLDDNLLLLEEGIIDSFGILGLINFIEKQFNLKISLSTVVSANFRTIGAIKSLVMSKLEAIHLVNRSPQPGSSLIPINPNGSKQPFFYVHGLVGYGFHPTLAGYLDPNRPFYGLQAIGLDGEKPPYTRIEEMVKHYIQEIQTIQPHGPYLLGGRCIGSMMAFEMAHQLKQRGQQVWLVAMVDCPNPFITAEQKNQAWTRWKSFGKEEKREKFQKSGFDPNSIKNKLEVIEANQQVVINYLPKTYSGRVVYFSAVENRQQPFVSNYDPMQPDGWNQFVAVGIEIIEVPGRHGTYHAEPHVQVLAAKLNACLEQVETEEQAKTKLLSLPKTNEITLPASEANKQPAIVDMSGLSCKSKADLPLFFDNEIEAFIPEMIMEKVETENQSSATNNAPLSPQSQSWMLTAQLLQDELTQTQAELQQSKEQLQHTQVELEELKLQFSQTQTDFEQSRTQFQTELKEYQTQNQEKTEALAVLKAEQSQTKTEFQEVKEKYDNKMAELDTLNHEYSQAKAEIQQYKAQLESTQNQLNLSEEQLHQSQTQVKQLEQQSLQTQAQLQQEKEQSEQTQAELSQFKEQYHQATTTLEVLQEKYSQVQLELEENQKELHQIQVDYQNSQEQLHLTQLDRNKTNEELQQSQVEIKKVNEELQQTQTELEQSKEQLYQTQLEHNKSKEKLQQSQLELKKVNEQLQQTKTELEQSQEQLNQTQQQFEELKSQQHQTQIQLEQSQIKLEQTQTQLEESETQLQQKTIELDKFKSQQHQARLAEMIMQRYNIPTG
jgi:thioesterase domain-containing protein/acyl carrier protein